MTEAQPACAIEGIGPAGARALTATDLARRERVSDPHVSPDGRFIAYNVRSTDWKGNRGVNALWVLERAAASAPRLIREQEKSASAPRGSANGRWLYFLFSRSGLTQVWRARASGAEVSQVTSLQSILPSIVSRRAPRRWSWQRASIPSAIPWLVARPRMTPRQRRRLPEPSTTARQPLTVQAWMKRWLDSG